MSTNQSPDLAAKIASENEYRVIEIVSRQAKFLALLLRGGRRASPNVEETLKLARELSAWLQAAYDHSPASQRAIEGGNRPDPLADDADLPTLLSAIGRDAQYLKRLTLGGIGMSRNVVEPRRVLAEMIAKMETLQARWPEMQGPDAIRLTPVRHPNGSRIVDEMIASGELNFERDPNAPDPLEKIIADSKRRGGIRPDYVR